MPTTSRYSVAPLPSTRTGKAGWRLVVRAGNMGMHRKYANTRYVPLYRRLRIIEKYNGMCVYCGGLANVVDHVVPWCFSRNSEDNNLVASCNLCNGIACGKVFSGFHAKKAYILAQRAERGDSVLYPWMSSCCWCHSYFKPGVDGATNLVCSSCMRTSQVEELDDFSQSEHPISRKNPSVAVVL